MKILSFESTCDETAVAVVEDGRKLLTDQIFSQADLHAVYGGVVPEIASRCHVESISILAQKAIEAAGITRQDIDAVAVSYAPGLIGAVLVGVNFAKSCALALNVPLIPVHHIRGHIAANYLAYPELEPPFLCLAISGGNTILVDVRGYTDMHILGATRDDAAGECFDKTARVLGLPYPGGKPIDLLSQGGDDTKYHFPISHVEGNPYDMSFSGLKTAVINLVHTAEQKGEEIDRASLAAVLYREPCRRQRSWGTTRSSSRAESLPIRASAPISRLRRRRTDSSSIFRRSSSAGITGRWSAHRRIMSIWPV